ncbi:MAG: hypothetical protein UX65_C0003G0030 [Parcubacteria group bacterium GW2011_GWB1_46_8]|nr:MAG: hypothetical protein UX14_C0018G0009 [Parcubacteria group bacterium GW2011_GWF1_45_5]KKU43438.1 MAG: hypothetical protein UX61_C0020G0010 [Parcubacteria group bacterium GW2011_GWA2_46_7]KKU46487.1 MAG: hypothetical protein UX65_C0003G0030 [Parcubacteria group bacterium GW2011_GWB1_46_8]KKU47044.1 MAG: hypothetical protein UX66_C0027G0010 [Parcubacteria group bacterium GW2011_GWF2_46_8]
MILAGVKTTYVLLPPSGPVFVPSHGTAILVAGPATRALFSLLFPRFAGILYI